jgi:hypothetical protein
MTEKKAPPPPLTYNGYDFSYSLSLLIGHYLYSLVGGAAGEPVSSHW